MGGQRRPSCKGEFCTKANPLCIWGEWGEQGVRGREEGKADDKTDLKISQKGKVMELVSLKMALGHLS